MLSVIRSPARAVCTSQSLFFSLSISFSIFIIIFSLFWGFRGFGSAAGSGQEVGHPCKILHDVADIGFTGGWDCEQTRKDETQKFDNLKFNPKFPPPVWASPTHDQCLGIDTLGPWPSRCIFKQDWGSTLCWSVRRVIL